MTASGLAPRAGAGFPSPPAAGEMPIDVVGEAISRTSIERVISRQGRQQG